MTRREAAIVSAYTGILIGSFNDFHKYAEDLFGTPIQTMMFASREFADELKERSKPDFILIGVTDDEGDCETEDCDAAAE